MSVKPKLSFSNVKTVRKAKQPARISSSCSCEKDQNKSNKSCGCGRRKDSAVDAVQDAGKELSQLFGQLKDEDTAEKLVRAIRCRDARTIQRIIGCDCRVVHFFCTSFSDCVKICCVFGKCHDVTISFDICIKRRSDCCQR
ncbi:MAG: hypothetical protein ACE3L7_15375 [Candidatus Pristimantibacillus sp.]